MKKFLTALLSLTVLLGAARAETFKRSDVIVELDSCEAIIREIQTNPRTAIPKEILQKAKGLVIVNQFQGSFIIGIKDGYAIAMVRRPNGKWSVPAFYKAGELSFGLQAGAKAINSVYVLLDDSASRLLLRNKMNLGLEAKVAAGIRAAEGETVTKSLPSQASVLIYSTVEGLYLGASVKTGFLSPDQKANELFYNATHRVPELLYSDWATPPEEARFIMDYVSAITQ